MIQKIFIVVRLSLSNLLPGIYILFRIDTLLGGGIRLNEYAQREGAYASGAWLWSAPSDSWLLEALLEKLAAFLSVLRTDNFFLGIYTNTTPNKKHNKISANFYHKNTKKIQI